MIEFILIPLCAICSMTFDFDIEPQHVAPMQCQHCSNITPCKLHRVPMSRLRELNLWSES